MIKRTLLLFGVLATLAAFASPAAQAESFWSSDPGDVPLGGPGEPVTFTGNGSVSSTIGSVMIGPIPIELHGFLWNGETDGQGVIDELNVTGSGFPTSLSPFGCNIDAVTSNTESGAELPITLKTEGAVEIGNLELIFHTTPHCVLLHQFGWAGTLTGQFNNVTGCLEFIQAGDLKIGSSNLALNGEICIAPELTANTVE